MDNTDEMDYESIASLLEGPAWVQYRTRVDLLGQPEGDPQVQAARQAMLSDPQVQRLAAEVAHWPDPILKSHNEAGHLLHKLVFLADLGLRSGDPGIDPVISRILEHQSPEGPFQVRVNIKPQYGGVVKTSGPGCPAMPHTDNGSDG